MSTMTEPKTQVYSVFIRATPEQVWDAITKPEFTLKYFYGTTFESDYAPGCPYRGFAADGSEQIEGVVIEADPPRLLRTTWRALWADELRAEPPSRVTWELEPAGEGVTKLTVVHDELEEAPKTAASVAGGWSLVVSGLKSVVETGEGLGL